MIGKQLDLFGGPPKPPKQITVDDDPPLEEEVPSTAVIESLPDTPTDTDTSAIETDECVVPELEAEAVLVHVQMPDIPEEDAVESEDDVHIYEISVDEPPMVQEEVINGVEEQNAPDDELTDDNLTPFADEQIVADESAETIIEVIAEDSNGENQEFPEGHGQTDEPEPILVENEQDPNEEPDIANIQADTLEANLEEPKNDELVEPQGTEVNIPDDVAGLNIPSDQSLYSRQYYTMRETAAMFNVNQSLLRFWENEFDILKPKKNRKGDRYFRPDDIKNLEQIYHLLKVRKFTIGGAKDYLKARAKSLDTFEMVQRLEKIKGFLLELKTHL